MIIFERSTTLRISEAAVRPQTNTFLKSAVRLAKITAPFAGAFAAGALAYSVSPEFHNYADQVRTVMSQHPTLFSAITSSLSMGLIPDYISQKYIGRKYDIFRTAGITTYMAFLGGVCLTGFYGLLNHAIPLNESLVQNILPAYERTFVDMNLWVPPTLLLYFGVTNLLQRKTFTEFKADVKENYKDRLFDTWKYWYIFAPLVHICPEDLKLYVANTLAIIYFFNMSRKMNEG